MIIHIRTKGLGADRQLYASVPAKETKGTSPEIEALTDSDNNLDTLTFSWAFPSLLPYELRIPKTHRVFVPYERIANYFSGLGAKVTLSRWEGAAGHARL